MMDKAGGRVALTRRQWDEHMSAWFERSARSRWAAAEPYWGFGASPERGCRSCLSTWLAWRAVEFGCGSGYVSAWLARRGARPGGVDVSARQLVTVHRLQDEFGLRFPLVQGTPSGCRWAPAVPTW